MKGIIYYTDNRLWPPIFERCKEYIVASGLPIISCSLKPVDLGYNIVVDGVRSYPTMVRQITTALAGSQAKNVFFCEHDVLYHKSHFNFTPPSDDTFYYNENVWRWWFKDDHAIRHKRMLPLSCLCVNREFALDHYQMRIQKIEEWGLDEFRSREPRRGRIWGYEPGTKPRRRGGFSDDKFDVWQSEFPNIDIRHHKTFSSPKIKQEDFIHKPEDWQEINVADIPGWELWNFQF